jgi:hypothetical protein
MRLFKSFNNSNAFCSALENSLSQSIEQEYGKQMSESLTLSQITKLKSYLCPIQNNRPSQRDQIKLREELAFKLLRDQQKPILKFRSSLGQEKSLRNNQILHDTDLFEDE